VAGTAFSDYPERNVDGSISTGKASHANQVKGDDPDKNKRDNPVLQVG